MENHTELELKLFEYIRFLMGLLNVHELAYHHVIKNLKEITEWKSKNWEIMDSRIKYDDMLNQLNKEFEWNLKLNNMDDEDTK